MRKMAVIIMLAVAFLSLMAAESTDVNVLNSGNSLYSNQYVENGPYRFVMEPDCNLVLYKNLKTLWTSGTSGQGKNCTATLQSNGSLVIHSDSGIIWKTKPGSADKSYYKLIVQTDGNVVIYGPSIWATNTAHQAVAFLSLMAVESTDVNVLNSGNSLYSNQYVENGPYRFVMEPDCSLVLYKNLNKNLKKTLWTSGTSGRGKNCTATLQSNGSLVIHSDSSGIIWKTKPGSADKSYYKLIVQTDGNVVIYGPSIWATNTAHQGESWTIMK